MPFAKLNADGSIASIFHSMVEEGLLEIDVHDPRMTEFLLHQNVDAAVNRSFIESDLDLVRVIEDLIDVLIERGAFRFTDLPEHAQEKLLKRRGLRKEFAYMATLFATEEEDEFPAIDIEGEGEGLL